MLARLGVPAPSDAGDREPIMAVVRALYAGPPVRLADYAGLMFEVDGDGTVDRILDDAAQRSRGPVPPEDSIVSLTCLFRLRGWCGDGWLARCC